MSKHNFDYLEDRFDVVIVGAGPVGLALALGLRGRSLSVLLLDQRARPELDPGLRRQLLVARSADLANLRDLGVDVGGDTVVRLHSMERHNGVTRESATGAPPANGPQALVPIGRLQRALLSLVEGAGVRVAYRAEVTRVRRHVRNVSVLLESGDSVQASMAFIATGAGRALVPRIDVVRGPARRMIGGVIASGRRAGTWLRAELETPAFYQPIRYTALFGGDAGTALIVDGPLGQAHSDTELARFFALAKRHAGIRDKAYLAAPQVFTTSVSSLATRSLSGDGRAPIVMVGDAAQTGHVFTGQVGLTNLGVAIDLAGALTAAAPDIARGKLHSPHLARALARYEDLGARAAATFRHASEPHFAPYRHGWAFGFPPPQPTRAGAERGARGVRVARASERVTSYSAGPLRWMGRPGFFYGGAVAA